MELSARCRPCGRTITVPTGLAGKTIQCPGCGAKVVLPALEPDGAATAYGLDREKSSKGTRRPRRANANPANPIVSPATLPWSRMRREKGPWPRMRLFLSVPIYILAVAAACVTAGLTALFVLAAVATNEPGEGNPAVLAIATFAVGGLVTIGLFWSADCVRKGRLLSPDEVINWKK